MKLWNAGVTAIEAICIGLLVLGVHALGGWLEMVLL